MSESQEAGFQAEDDWGDFRKENRRQRQKREQSTPRPGYLIELSGQAISLDYLEYRILQFLSDRPYKAFTKRQIVAAVNSPQHPVTEETLDRHVMTLREKLGLFSDYVQSVPYVGYRFKE
ncbi:MAG: helix-turn-helix domain-containing protein [Planctomycetales bacterium]|nr:helix-turn-helix domain-containing protein [Planctomycetales bacterium]MCA9171018.1 helix-turn-helix domain-containing protein [Planctomycetales bacterium]